MTTERGAHYSVSQHHIVWPDDRERYTLQCLTALHRTTWRQSEAHITVSHSTASYDRRLKKKHITVSHRARTSKNKRQVLASLRCPDLSSSFYTEKFRTRECRITCNARFSCNKFLTLTRLVCWTRTQISPLCVLGVLMLRWVLKGLRGHFVFWLKHRNHPVKIPVAFLGKFHR